MTINCKGDIVTTEKLHMYYCSTTCIIDSLPGEIGKLRKLEKLFLQKNHLEELPSVSPNTEGVKMIVVILFCCDC